MSIMIVQFLHTSGEHSFTKSKNEGEKLFKDWNCDIKHQRKYLCTTGAYIKNGKKIEVKENDTTNKIYFWGEWEPQSEVTRIVNQDTCNDDGALPHFIHEPFLRLNESGQLIKGDKNSTPTNTDPFVFGEDGFYYSYCMQSIKTLQELDPGSIILFGSTIKRDTPDAYFALDTVFVVGPKENKLKYNINNDLSELEEFAPKYYLDIMNYKSSENNPNCSCNKSKSEGCEKEEDFTCYRGASYKNPINGMYSFAPCKVGSEGEKGFERVKLTKDSFNQIYKEAIISNNNAQGVNYTKTDKIQDNFKIWTKLCEIIENNGCYEAVKLNYTVR
ncbi:hypothetical protein [Prevotella herbatica]|nr:hypothetical protein [Prevotella herbatica]